MARGAKTPGYAPVTDFLSSSSTACPRHHHALRDENSTDETASMSPALIVSTPARVRLAWSLHNARLVRAWLCACHECTSHTVPSLFLHGVAADGHRASGLSSFYILKSLVQSDKSVYPRTRPGQCSGRGACIPSLSFENTLIRRAFGLILLRVSIPFFISTAGRLSLYSSPGVKSFTQGPPSTFRSRQPRR